jgi:hypothetical protein
VTIVDIERDVAVHTFPDGYQVVVETADSPGRKVGRISWNCTVALFGLEHADRIFDRADVVWRGGHPGNYGHDDPFVAA